MTTTGPVPGWLGAIVVVALALLGGGGFVGLLQWFTARRSGERSADTAAFHEISAAWPALLDELRKAQDAEDKRHSAEIERIRAEWQQKFDEVKDRLEQCEEGRAEMREVISMLSHGFEDGE